ncbi:MAG: hypothetical protein AAFX08_09290 [Pseudomonadota bacterium]
MLQRSNSARRRVNAVAGSRRLTCPGFFSQSARYKSGWISAADRDGDEEDRLALGGEYRATASAFGSDHPAAAGEWSFPPASIETLFTINALPKPLDGGGALASGLERRDRAAPGAIVTERHDQNAGSCAASR